MTTSISFRARLAALSIGVAMLAVATTTAHHSILAKFDDTKAATLKGLVTLVDWTNPHVHVFMNVRDAKGQVVNWAVELESPIDLNQSGWNQDTLRPGDGITVQGISARNGSRQVWARSVVVTATGREVFKVTRTAPPAPLSPRPVPKFADGTVRLGATPGASGYWVYPSATALVEDGMTVAMDPVRAVEERGRRIEGGTDAAMGAGALSGPPAALSAGRSHLHQLQAPGAGRVSSSSPSACSSWRTASGSASSR